MTGTRFHLVLVCGLVLFAFGMAALVNRSVFERLPHLEDEYAYIFQARVFARGDIVMEIPETRRAFWQPFVIDYPDNNSRFGKYSPGWPALLAVGEWLGQLWFINAAFAALTVAVVYRLGREVFNADTGTIAAALTAFSPMALLLNASYMGHTSALFFFTLFMYAYWRMDRTGSVRWGLLAGLALGVLIVNRPLSALGVALPFILWSGLKTIRAALASHLWTTIKPYLALAAVALVIAGFLPLYNYAATGDAGKNLYTLVWSYDRIGFGECCGRSGHTIVKGIRHTRFDLSLFAADLFGWQITPVTAEIQDHLRTASDFYPVLGLSLFILPFGLWIGFRRWWMRGWLLVMLFWLLFPLLRDMAFIRGLPRIGGEYQSDPLWLWLAAGAIPFLTAPIAIGKQPDRQTTWTWLLLAVFVGLVSVHLAYWVGSQRYSTRYYFETLTALSLIAALPLAWIIQRLRKLSPLAPVSAYGAIGVLLLWSLYTYSTPRIESLYRYNQVSGEMLEAVEERRIDDRPVLILISAESVRWRAYGALMAMTGPYRDTDIVAAWDYSAGGSARQEILDQFAGRQLIEMEADGNDSWFVD